ncbi:unnamed protein product [Symbiodinium sp. CCMP2592]|nr:unnamed protein product [Symbiodinium sp. CCMP2592]
MANFAGELVQNRERCFAELRRARRAYSRDLERNESEVLADPTSARARQDTQPEQLRALIQVCRCDDLPSAEVVIYLAFRGTVNQDNLVTDLYAELVPWDIGDAVISTARVHRGFQDAYRALRSGVLGRLDADLAKFNVAASRVLLRATGHSLGGALAMLACLDLATCRGFAA